MDFLSEGKAAAALGLGSRKEDLTAFHKLDLPSTLNVTFLNTNCIENSYHFHSYSGLIVVSIYLGTAAELIF